LCFLRGETDIDDRDTTVFFFLFYLFHR